VKAVKVVNVIHLLNDVILAVNDLASLSDSDRVNRRPGGGCLLASVATLNRDCSHLDPFRAAFAGLILHPFNQSRQAHLRQFERCNPARGRNRPFLVDAFQVLTDGIHVDKAFFTFAQVPIPRIELYLFPRSIS
jgi:hypothetical protein